MAGHPPAAPLRHRSIAPTPTATLPPLAVAALLAPPAARRLRVACRLDPNEGSFAWSKDDPDACSGLRVDPVPGSSAMWYNFLDGGVVDNRMYHAGCDVTEGVKYGANMWLHDTMGGGRLAEKVA